MVGRKVGREPLEAGADPADVHAWTIDDAARIAAAGRRRARRAEGELAELYRYGDAAERRGVLRALPYLDLGDRGLGLDRRRDPHQRHAADRGRARPVRHRAPVRTPQYDQAVLKCVFVGVPDHRRSTASPSA